MLKLIMLIAILPNSFYFSMILLECKQNKGVVTMTEGMQEVLDIIQMVFDTIRKFILLILGRGDEIEGENPEV